MNLEGIIQGAKLMVVGMTGIVITSLLFWAAISTMRRLFPPRSTQ